jgi:hypothetical protein
VYIGIDVHADGFHSTNWFTLFEPYVAGKRIRKQQRFEYETANTSRWIKNNSAVWQFTQVSHPNHLTNDIPGSKKLAEFLLSRRAAQEGLIKA